MPLSEYNMTDERQIMLLGVSKKVLVRVFGEPSATFRYHDKELLHYGQPGLSFVELENGVISRCETSPDRRAAFRVQPSVPTNIHIINGVGELSGVIVDLSTSGMAIQHQAETRLSTSG